MTGTLKSLCAALLFLGACTESAESVLRAVSTGEGDTHYGALPAEHVWSIGLGTRGTDYGSSVVATADGGAVVGGSVAVNDGSGISTFNLGGEDLQAGVFSTGFVAKYDDAGAPVWSRSFASTGAASVNAVEVGPDGSVVVQGVFTRAIDLGAGGGTVDVGDEGAMFVAKLAPDGQLLWARVLGRRADGRAIAIGADGDVYVFGNFWGNTTIDGIELASTRRCILAIRLAADGTTTWARLVGASDRVVTPDAMTSDGEIVAVAAVADPGGVIVGGQITGEVALGVEAPALGGQDGIVLALDPDGGTRWVKRFGGPDGDGVGALAISEGRVAVGGVASRSATIDGFTIAGDTATSWDPFLAAIPLDGGPAFWARRLDTDGSVFGVEWKRDGTLVAVGYANRLGGEEAPGPFVGTFSGADGSMLVGRAYPAQEHGRFYDVAADPNDKLLLLGGYNEWYGATVDLGGGFLPNLGAQDVMLAKLAF